MSMNFLEHWQLDPSIDFLNHGSFGATPKTVLKAQRDWIDALERDPIRFLAPERELIPKLDEVRERVASLVNAPASSIVFVRNATDGVNAVLRSMNLQAGDEVVITNHGYNACNNAVRFATDRCSAKTRTANIPFPIETEEDVLVNVESQLSDRTKLLVVDHVTSPTGLVFPIERIIAVAHRYGIRVLIDGAHAPGMLPLDLKALQADYYTANHHKWLCAPKASGFLYVDPRWQDEVRPTVISHGANRPPSERSKYLDEFDWVGTYDPTPVLSVPTAIDFVSQLYPGGLEELMSANRHHALEAQRILADAMNIPLPSPASMIGSLAAIPIMKVTGELSEHPALLQQRLYQEHNIEVPIFGGLSPDSCLLRVSLQAYNHLGQIERLASALRQMLPS